MIHVSAEVRGQAQVGKSFLDRILRLKRQEVVTSQVGYAAPYAIYVHEDLQAYHAPPTRAKFLSEPFQRLRGRIADRIAVVIQRGGDLLQAVYEAGELVLSESRPITPIDTGLLRASAFNRVTNRFE